MLGKTVWELKNPLFQFMSVNLHWIGHTRCWTEFELQWQEEFTNSCGFNWINNNIPTKKYLDKILFMGADILRQILKFKGRHSCPQKEIEYTDAVHLLRANRVISRRTHLQNILFLRIRNEMFFYKKWIDLPSQDDLLWYKEVQIAQHSPGVFSRWSGVK